MRELFYMKRFGFELFIGLTGRALPWSWYGDGFQLRRLAVDWATPWGANIART